MSTYRGPLMLHTVVWLWFAISLACLYPLRICKFKEHFNIRVRVSPRQYTGCPPKNASQLWYSINQVSHNGHECYLYHYLQQVCLHMLVKFSRKIMSIFWDIALKLNAPIFQFAQILDKRQSTTISTSFKCWVFQDLFINATPSKTCH